MKILNILLTATALATIKTETYDLRDIRPVAVATNEWASYGETKCEKMPNPINKLDQVEIVQYTSTFGKTPQNPAYEEIYYTISTIYKIYVRSLSTHLKFYLYEDIYRDTNVNLGADYFFWFYSLYLEDNLTNNEINTINNQIDKIKKGIFPPENEQDKYYNEILMYSGDSLPSGTALYEGEGQEDGQAENNLTESYERTLLEGKTYYICSTVGYRVTKRNPHGHDIELYIYGQNTSALELQQQIPDTPQEVIDLPGTMWTVLGMPFTFISQAFNLTLFPGTQWAVNVAEILFFILGGMLIVLAIKLLISSR